MEKNYYTPFNSSPLMTRSPRSVPAACFSPHTPSKPSRLSHSYHASTLTLSSPSPSRSSSASSPQNTHSPQLPTKVAARKPSTHSHRHHWRIQRRQDTRTPNVLPVFSNLFASASLSAAKKVYTLYRSIANLFHRPQGHKECKIIKRKILQKAPKKKDCKSTGTPSSSCQQNDSLMTESKVEDLFDIRTTASCEVDNTSISTSERKGVVVDEKEVPSYQRLEEQLQNLREEILLLQAKVAQQVCFPAPDPMDVESIDMATLLPPPPPPPPPPIMTFEGQPAHPMELKDQILKEIQHVKLKKSNVCKDSSRGDSLRVKKSPHSSPSMDLQESLTEALKRKFATAIEEPDISCKEKGLVSPWTPPPSTSESTMGGPHSPKTPSITESHFFRLLENEVAGNTYQPLEEMVVPSSQIYSEEAVPSPKRRRSLRNM